MGKKSNIEWTDHTFNPWIGCTKVSPGCDNCYAETFANRFGKVKWGTGQDRQMTSNAYWLQPLKWNEEAWAAGVRHKVFCASLADVFDNEVSDVWRHRLWDLIMRTPHLDWLLLTKRIGNAGAMLPMMEGRDSLGRHPLPNIWLGASIVNQEEADRDIPKLLATPARIRFLSMEPLLGPVKFRPYTLTARPCPVCSVADIQHKERDQYSHPINCGWRHDLERKGKRNLEGGVDNSGIDWVIVGGESGKDARPIMTGAMVRSLRDQCVAAGVPFLFKQWGEWRDELALGDDRRAAPLYFTSELARVGKKNGGRMLDGREWNESPVVL